MQHRSSRGKLWLGHHAGAKSRSAVMGGFRFRRLSRRSSKAEKKALGLPHRRRAHDPCLLASDGIFPSPPHPSQAASHQAPLAPWLKDGDYGAENPSLQVSVVLPLTLTGILV